MPASTATPQTSRTSCAARAPVAAGTPAGRGKEDAPPSSIHPMGCKCATCTRWTGWAA